MPQIHSGVDLTTFHERGIAGIWAQACEPGCELWRVAVGVVLKKGRLVGQIVVVVKYELDVHASFEGYVWRVVGAARIQTLVDNRR